MSAVPQGKSCATCAHFAIDEFNKGYCVSLASRNVTLDCLSAVDMITKGICGPTAKWVHWEKKT